MLGEKSPIWRIRLIKYYFIVFFIVVKAVTKVWKVIFFIGNAY